MPPPPSSSKNLQNEADSVLLCLFLLTLTIFTVCLCVSSGNQRPLSCLAYWFSYNFGDDDIQEVCCPAIRETSVSLYPGVWLRVGQNHQ